MIQDVINNQFLELAKFVTVKTPRELELEDLLTSARAIAQRCGEQTAWGVFDSRLRNLGIGCVTPRVFKILPDKNAR